jgi:hypothetical protein
MLGLWYEGQDSVLAFVAYSVKEYYLIYICLFVLLGLLAFARASPLPQADAGGGLACE